jgi:hypothetical protein
MRDLSNQIDNLPHVQSMILLSCFEVQSPKQLNPQIIILSLFCISLHCISTQKSLVFKSILKNTH